MLSSEDCLKEAESNISLGKPINLRNAARCLGDFARIVFADLGKHYSTYRVVKELSIKNRFLMLSPLIPELTEYEDLFLGIDHLRNVSEHGEIVIPDASELSDLLIKATKFESVFRGTILPRLTTRKAPKQYFEDEWKLIPPMLEMLEQYVQWHFSAYDDLKPEIERLRGMYLGSSDLDDNTIQEARLALNKLQFELQDRIRQGEIEYHDALADSYSR